MLALLLTCDHGQRWSNEQVPSGAVVTCAHNVTVTMLRCWHSANTRGQSALLDLYACGLSWLSHNCPQSPRPRHPDRITPLPAPSAQRTLPTHNFIMKMPAIHLRFGSRDKYLWISLLAEFIGSGLYQLLGGVSGDDPLQSAFAFAGIQYATKYISGGHINPAVSLAALLSGHIDYVRGLSYIVAQFLGAIGGAMFQAWLSPDSDWGKTGPGCFAPVKDLSNWGLLGWETIMTFLFIAVHYTSIFVRPGHGDASPLASAFTLFAALSTGGTYTGNSPLNPARNLAGSLVFKCFWGWTFVYIAAQLTASILAAGWSLLVFGKGDFYQHGTATGGLRETLLGGTGGTTAGEPAGAVPYTWAPTGYHYAGSTPVSSTEPQTIPSSATA